MQTILIIIGLIIALISIAAGIILGLKRLARKNNLFTYLPKESGKIVMTGDNVVEILNNFEEGYYDSTGQWTEGEPQNLGELFEELGLTYYGLTPIKEIYNFSVFWKAIVDKEVAQLGDHPVSPVKQIVPQKEMTDHFKRFYSHSVTIPNIEMEGEVKVDVTLTIVFKVLNIIKAIFQIDPRGIVFPQSEDAVSGALQDYLRGKNYETFRDDEDKISPNSDFIRSMSAKIDEVIKTKLFIGVHLIEFKSIELSSEDEEMKLAIKAKKIAELKGDAFVIERNKSAEGEARYIETMKNLLNEEDFSTWLALYQSKTGLLVPPTFNLKNK